MIDKASYIDNSVTQRGISPTALVMLLRFMLCRRCKMYQCCVVLKDHRDDCEKVSLQFFDANITR